MWRDTSRAALVKQCLWQLNDERCFLFSLYSPFQGLIRQINQCFKWGRRVEEEVRCEVILAALQMRALTCLNGVFCRNDATTEATTVTVWIIDSSEVACDIKAAWISGFPRPLTLSFRHFQVNKFKENKKENVERSANCLQSWFHRVQVRLIMITEWI